MKRLALLLALFASAIQAFGSTTVSGKLTNPDTSGAVPGYANFELFSCGGNFPVVAGVSIATTQQFALNSDGTWSGTIYRNDEISCNGDTTSNWWRLSYYVSGRRIGPFRDIRLTTINCNTSCSVDGITPLTVYPTIPAPAGDTTYLRLDGGNQPNPYVFTQGVRVNGTLTANGSINSAGNNTFTGSNTFSNTLNSCRTNGVRLVDSNNTCGWAGPDICANINSAYADLPAQGGRIRVSGGSFVCTTPIAFTTLNKYVVLDGDPSTGTTLLYTPASGTFVTFNNGRAGLPLGQGLRDIKLQTLTGGTAAIGVLVGGSNGSVGWYGLNYQVSGFGTNLQLGNNVQSMLSDHCQLIEGAQGFLYPSGLTSTGEQITFRDCIFANSTTWTADYVRINPSAANNATLWFDNIHIDGAQLHSSGGDLNVFGLHMENTTNTTIAPNYYILVDGGVATFNSLNLISEQTLLPTGFVNVAGGSSVSVNGYNLQNTGGSINGFHVTNGSQLNLAGLKGLVGSITLSALDGGASFSRIDHTGIQVGATADFFSNTGITINGVTGTNWGCLYPGVAHLCEMDTSGNFGVLGFIGAASYRGAFFKSTSANPAATGNVELANSDSICFRDAGNANDHCFKEFQHVRGVAGCTTGAVAGNTCSTPITVTWPSAFADTNYSASCWPSGPPTQFPSTPYLATRTASAITVNYFALNAAAAAWASIECIAYHD